MNAWGKKDWKEINQHALVICYGCHLRQFSLLQQAETNHVFLVLLLEIYSMNLLCPVPGMKFHEAPQVFSCDSNNKGVVSFSG